MYVTNCRLCPLTSKFTGFVLNISKSRTLFSLGQTQLDFLVKVGRVQGTFVIFPPKGLFSK
ncbi:hypothetical protein Hanom_Chr04g00295061 [Helianthus anomalus]